MIKLAAILLLTLQCAIAALVQQSQLPLRTQGRWIVDQMGKRVKLSCVNWHGAHMNTFVPSGLHVQTSKTISRLLREFGINCVRLQWSVELVKRNPVVNHDAIRAMREAGVITNPNARALDVYDQVVADLASERVMVILDNHMSNAGWCCDVRDKNGLWFNEYYGVAQWFEAWEFMAARFASQFYVIGCDLRNELRPDIRINGKLSWISLPTLEIRMPAWGGGDRVMPLKEYAPEVINYSNPALKTIKQQAITWIIKKLFSSTPIYVFDWQNASTIVSNKITAKNPNVLIFVQGVFDTHSYTPNVMQIIFFYLKTDEALYNSIGRYFDIPENVTQVYQLHNLTGMQDLPVGMVEPHRLVYSSHIYPFFYAGSQFAWDGINPTFENYSAIVDKFWGYLFRKDIAPVWVGEYGTNADKSGITPAWVNYTLRYLDDNDLDHGYWPIGDSRPTINELTGAYDHGSDDFALLNRQYDYIKYNPLYESIKPLFTAKLGPGIGDQPPVARPPVDRHRAKCTGFAFWCFLKSLFQLDVLQN